MYVIYIIYKTQLVIMSIDSERSVARETELRGGTVGGGERGERRWLWNWREKGERETEDRRDTSERERQLIERYR